MRALTHFVRGLWPVVFGLWLVALLAVGTTILLFFAGLIVPNVTVRTIIEGWVWTALVLGVLVVGGFGAQRKLGRLLGRPALRGYGWSTLFAVSLIVLFYVVERWRGHHAWQSLESELAGEPPQLIGLEPSPVSPAENLAAIPVVEAWWREPSSGGGREGFHRLGKRVPGDGGGAWELQEPVVLGVCLKHYLPSAIASGTTEEISARQFLEAWQEFGPELEQLSAAAERPYARFELPYDRGMFDDSLERRLELFRAVREVFRLRAVAALADGATGRALADVERLFQISDLVGQEPLLERQRLALLLGAIQPVWEGIRGHRWSEAQLTALQVRLSRPELLLEHRRAVRIEALLLIDLCEKLFPVRSRKPPVDRTEEVPSRMLITGARLVYPSGWSLQNQVGLHRLSREIGEHTVAVDQHRVFVDITRQIMREWVYRPPSLDPFFATFIMPRGGEVAAEATQRYAYAQCALDLAATACALERYRIARRQLPERLELLVPDWIERTPVDVIDGRPLRYKRLDRNRYLLYSVGWNQVDDGGEVAQRPGQRQSWEDSRQRKSQGDWVWNALTAE